jgi:hypothetical protein
MHERSQRTVSSRATQPGVAFGAGRSRARRRGHPLRGTLAGGALPVLLATLLAGAGCAGNHVGPRVLAGLGAVAIAGGSGTWAAGEGLEGGSHPVAAQGLIGAGFVSVVSGLVAIVVAGGWMAASVACVADPDCPEDEQCREVPAPPGGIPFKQCVPR